MPALLTPRLFTFDGFWQCQPLDTGLSRTKAGDTGAPGHVTDDVSQGDLAGAALEAVFKLKL